MSSKSGNIKPITYHVAFTNFSSDVPVNTRIYLGNKLTPFMMLIDSGNQSKDLIDYKTWKRAFPNRSLEPTNARIETAEAGKFLKIAGRPKKPIRIYIEGLPYPVESNPLVVYNLGTRAIWSAKSMKDIPIVPNLHKGIAKIGPNRHSIKLYPDVSEDEDENEALEVENKQSS